jgi:hypothetical protein
LTVNVRGAAGIFVLILAGLTSLLLTADCGDDKITSSTMDTSYVTVYDTMIYDLLLHLRIRLTDTVYFSGSCHRINNSGNTIDSCFIIKGDQCVSFGESFKMVEGDGTRVTDFKIPADSIGVQPGENLHLEFYSDDDVSTGDVTLLNWGDEISWVSPGYDDSTVKGSSLTIHWHPVPHAEWYAVFLDRYDTINDTAIEELARYVSDTVLTIDGSDLDYYGYCWLIVDPGTGPRGDIDEGNIAGGNMVGYICGYGRSNLREIVIINPGPRAPAIPPPDQTEKGSGARQDEGGLW